MSNKVKIAIVALIIFFLVIGHYAKQAEIEANKPVFPDTSVEVKNPQAEGDALAIDNMKETCEQSYKVIDGALEQLCGDYIDIVQSRGFEVLSKDGEFWAEVYSE